MLRTLADIADAYDAGQFHVQRFLKNAGTAHALGWADPTFSSGQPAYDAHVGTPLKFTPCVAAGNDSIYLPPVGPGQERYLHTATLWSNQSTYNGPGSVVLFDLLGYYPLIDGDSTDAQACDNTLTLPRYASGQGVFAVWVNHVAPAVQNGVAVVGLTNSDGSARTVTMALPNNGVNLVCTGTDTVSSAAFGALSMPLGSGSKGVRSIDSITYTVPPGGLHCIYLVRVLSTMTLGDNQVAAEKDFFAQDGFRMPRLFDGAWLGWFDNLSTGATARQVNWWGNFTVVWG